MDEGIVDLGNVPHRSVLEQDIDLFIGRIIGGIGRFSGKDKISASSADSDSSRPRRDLNSST
jgi:hypothetical protein